MHYRNKVSPSLLPSLKPIKVSPIMTSPCRNVFLSPPNPPKQAELASASPPKDAENVTGVLAYERAHLPYLFDHPSETARTCIFRISKRARKRPPPSSLPSTRIQHGFFVSDFGQRAKMRDRPAWRPPGLPSSLSLPEMPNLSTTPSPGARC